MLSLITARRFGLALALIAVAVLATLDIEILSRQLYVLGGTPFLHAMEGNSVAVGLRVWHGENPYPDPIADAAMAHMYPPLGYAIIGLAWIAAPNQYYLPRIAACLAYFGAVALIAIYIKRDRGAISAAWASVAALALTGFAGDYFFFALVNSFYLFFLMAAWLAGLRHLRSGGSPAWAALLAVAAILTKQQAIAVPVVVCSILLYRRAWRNLIIYSGVVMVGTAAIALLLHLASAGWSTRTMLLGFRHPLYTDYFVDAVQMLMRPHFVCILASAAVALIAVARERMAWTLFVVIELCVCMITRAKWGGTEQSILPASFVMIACAARALPALGDATSRRSLAAAVLALVGAILVFRQAAPVESLAERKTLYERHAADIDRVLTSIPVVDGKVLTIQYGEASILRRHRVFDDLEVALEFELAGYPVLERIASSLERKEYAMILFGSPDRVLEAGARFHLLPSSPTAARVKRCADAIERGYTEAPVCPIALIPK